jgi:hypothetical protein
MPAKIVSHRGMPWATSNFHMLLCIFIISIEVIPRLTCRPMHPGLTSGLRSMGTCAQPATSRPVRRLAQVDGGDRDMPPGGDMPKRNRRMTTVGLIGLGIMGMAYARNLRKAGLPCMAMIRRGRADGAGRNWRGALRTMRAEVTKGRGCDPDGAAQRGGTGHATVSEMLPVLRAGQVLAEMGTLPLPRSWQPAIASPPPGRSFWTAPSRARARRPKRPIW